MIYKRLLVMDAIDHFCAFYFLYHTLHHPRNKNIGIGNQRSHIQDFTAGVYRSDIQDFGNWE